MKKYILTITLIILLFAISVISTSRLEIEESIVTEDTSFVYTRLFNDDILHDIRIYMTRDEWLGLGEDVLDYAKYDNYMRTGNYRVAKVEYEDQFGLYFISNIGIRTRGNTTRVVPGTEDNVFKKAHFKLNFNSFEEKTFLGLNELYLKSNRSEDLSYIREDYAYDLFEEFNINTSKSSFTTLTFYIDDQVYDFGVYEIIEPIDKTFLTKRYSKKANDGNLYKCLWQNFGPATLSIIKDDKAVGSKDWKKGYRPSYDLQTNIDLSDYDDLYEFIYKLNTLSGDKLKAYLDKNFEIDKFLKTLALNVCLGMPDDYWAMGNNYYLYFNDVGKIEFFPYDYDNSLGGGWDGAHFGGYEGIATADIFEWNDTASVFMNTNYSYPLVEKVLVIPEYRDKYLESLENIISSNQFNFDYYSEKAKSISNLYEGKFINVADDAKDIELTHEAWYFDTKIESIKFQLEEY